MTDKEIAREITLDEILSYFKERVKDFFATYKNESGGEDRIEICLIREGYRTLLRAEEKLKRQQAENERLNAEKDNLIKTYGECMTEAIKEFAEKFEIKIKDVQFTLGQTWEIQNALKDTLKEMTE